MCLILNVASMDGCWWRNKVKEMFNKKKQQNVERMPVNGQFLRTTVNIHQQMFNTHPAMRREEKLRAFHIILLLLPTI